MKADRIVEVNNLEVRFRLDNGIVVDAVKDISFHIATGETLALVGESGSGKSVISQSIMGILPTAAQVTSGSILFDDSGGSRRPGHRRGGSTLRSRRGVSRYRQP